MLKTPFDKEQAKAAKKAGKALSQTYSFWFRRKYNLSPRDPRFLELTPEEVEAEYWAHHYADSAKNGELAYEAEDDSFDVDQIIAGWAAEEDEFEDLINEH